MRKREGFVRVHDALRREPESALEQELRVSVRIRQEGVRYLLGIQREAGRRVLETPSCDETVAALDLSVEVLPRQP